MHICVTRPEWVDSSPPSRIYTSTNWVIIGPGNGLLPVRRQVITWTNAGYCQLDSWEHISVKFESEFYHFQSRKLNWKCCLPQWQPFYPGGDELTNMVIQILHPYYRSYRRHQTECVFMHCYWVFSPAANWQVVNILMRVETMDIAKYKINLTLQSQRQLNLQAVSIPSSL